MLCGSALMQQAALLDGLSVEAFAFEQDSAFWTRNPPARSLRHAEFSSSVPAPIACVREFAAEL
jgi:hypothetical protein